MTRHTVFLGFGCNNRCVVCAQGDLRSTGPAVDLEQARKALEAVGPGDVVAFTGGEPTLVDALPELLARATSSGAKALLQTNARRLAYPAYAAALAEAAKGLAIDASLFGSSAAMHDYHTRAPGSFAQTARGLQNARARGLRIGVTVVVTRSNFRHLSEIVRLARTLGADAVHFAPVEPAGAASEQLRRLTPDESLVEPHIEAASAEARRLGITAITGDPQRAGLDHRFAGTGVTA